MRLNYFVFLDVDNTILLKDENRQYVINQALLDQLKMHGYMKIYLFTNMDLGDHEQLINAYEEPDSPKRLSRQDILNELKQQGFDVFGVITPADMGYNKGLGAAFADLYQTAYGDINAKIMEGKLHCDKERDAHRQRNAAYQRLFPVRPANSRLSPLAFNKQKMFLYFLNFMQSEKTTHVLYLDDDIDCLKAIADVESDKMVKVTTGLVVDGKLVKEVNLAHFYSPAIATKILQEISAQVGIKLPKSAKKYIDFIGESYIADLLSPEKIVLNYIATKLGKNPKPSFFLMVLLAHVTGKEVTKENFYSIFKPDAQLKPAAEIAAPRLTRVKFFSQATSSSAPSSSHSSTLAKKG